MGMGIWGVERGGGEREGLWLNNLKIFWGGIVLGLIEDCWLSDEDFHGFKPVGYFHLIIYTSGKCLFFLTVVFLMGLIKVHETDFIYTYPFMQLLYSTSISNRKAIAKIPQPFSIDL